MIIPIVEYPDVRVNTACMPVEFPYQGLSFQIADMIANCRAHKGVGLAANQLGIMSRIIVYTDNAGELQCLINPEILEFSEETATATEGCLSLPGLELDMTRSVEITVKGLTESLQEVTLVATGMEARVIQHEIDHLDGFLIVDFLGKLNRSMTLSKWMKQRKVANRRYREMEREKVAA